MSQLEALQQLQPKIASYQAQLTKLFDELLGESGADQGFLAFEDLNRHLSIVASKGDYWHLSRDQGATGAAVNSGKPSITDANATIFKPTDAEPISELIYPLRIEGVDEPIGAILLDNVTKNVRFTPEHHYPMLERYERRIAEILSEADPWNFRKWWESQQRIKRDDLFSTAHRLVQQSLDDAARGAAGAPALEARVEEVTADGSLRLFGSVMGQSGAARPSDADIVSAALRTGQPTERPAGITRYERHIPFPLSGPVQGIITFVSQEDDGCPDELVDALLTALQALDYRHYAPTSLAGRPMGAEHYFNLVLQALTASASPTLVHATLEQIADRAQALCAADLQIVYAPTGGEDGYTSERVRRETLEVILKEFEAEGAVSRPFCRKHGDWLRCPILVRGEIRGLVQVQSEGDRVSDSYNSEIVVVVAMLVSELFTSLRPV